MAQCVVPNALSPTPSLPLIFHLCGSGPSIFLHFCCCCCCQFFSVCLCKSGFFFLHSETLHSIFQTAAQTIVCERNLKRISIHRLLLNRKRYFIKYFFLFAMDVGGRAHVARICCTYVQRVCVCVRLLS